MLNWLGSVFGVGVGKAKNRKGFQKPNSELGPNLNDLLFESIGELPIRHAQVRVPG